MALNLEDPADREEALGRYMAAGWSRGQALVHIDEKIAAARKAREHPTPPAVLTMDAIRKMTPAEQRSLATARWPEVAAALGNKRPPGPITAAEVADLPRTAREHPELINEDNWPTIAAELERRAGGGR